MIDVTNLLAVAITIERVAFVHEHYVRSLIINNARSVVVQLHSKRNELFNDVALCWIEDVSVKSSSLNQTLNTLTLNMGIAQHVVESPIPWLSLQPRPYVAVQGRECQRLERECCEEVCASHNAPATCSMSV